MNLENMMIASIIKSIFLTSMTLEEFLVEVEI